MVCGVCHETFTGEGAKERMLNHCVNAHSEESRGFITNANGKLLREVGLNWKKYRHIKDGQRRRARGLADICASTIPYEFPPHEFEERFVHAKKGEGKTTWTEAEENSGRRSTTEEKEREENRQMANLPNKGKPGKLARRKQGLGGPGSDAGGGKQNRSSNGAKRKSRRKTRKKRGGYDSCLNTKESQVDRDAYCFEMDSQKPKCDTNEESETHGDCIPSRGSIGESKTHKKPKFRARPKEGTKKASKGKQPCKK